MRIAIEGFRSRCNGLAFIDEQISLNDERFARGVLGRGACPLTRRRSRLNEIRSSMTEIWSQLMPLRVSDDGVRIVGSVDGGHRLGGAVQR